MTHPIIDGGFKQDLQLLSARLSHRRKLLALFGASGLLELSGCGGGSASNTPTTQAPVVQGPVSGGVSVTCSVIPSETAGPFPGDGTNTAPGISSNALALTGIQRSDIRSSFAGASGVAAGVVLNLSLTLKNTNSACGNLAGYAIYLWHCDALGRYSLYSSGATAENYLRGLQVTDANGKVNFTTIVPGCYDGRWPHIHFEVFTSAAAATRGNNSVKTSQLALPQNMVATVYAGSGYAGSTANLARVSLTSDGIFSDGSSLQLATVSGSIAAGYSASLDVNISA